MNIFKNMDQPESNDITKHPGYASLSDADRKAVNEVYSSVYLSRQHLGEKIAQGTAYEAAKQMCEAVNDKKKPTNYAPGATYENETMDEELIHGKKLNSGQHKKVLDAFVHRYTGEHKPYWANKPMPNGEKYKPTHATDKEWVHDHAFHFNKGTNNLSGNHNHAEDGCMAEEDDIVKQAVANPTKRGPNDYGVTKQAIVPQAHPITFDAKSNTPPVPHAELPATPSTDPEDGNSKGIQKKNWAEKCPKCGMFPCACPGSMKEEDDEDEFKPTQECGSDCHRNMKHSALCPHSNVVAEGKNHTFKDIEHGDSVKYKTPQGQVSSGTAHIYGGDSGDHWVLRNSSRSGGSGSIVTPKNFHSVKKNGKKLSSSAHFLVYGSGGKPKNEEVDPYISAAIGYINQRAEVKGIMESVDLSEDSRPPHKLSGPGALTMPVGLASAKTRGEQIGMLKQMASDPAHSYHEKSKRLLAKLGE
jgi:hypothetical protein